MYLFKSYQTYIERISKNAYLNIGADEGVTEPSYNFHFRETLINLSCGASFNSCLTDTTALLVPHISGIILLPDHRLKTIQFHGTRRLNSTFYFSLWNTLYKETSMTLMQRRNILDSLANTEDKINLQLFLDSVFIQNGENASSTNDVFINYTIDERNEIIQIIVNINPLGVDMAMKFLKDPVNKAKILINR